MFFFVRLQYSISYCHLRTVYSRSQLSMKHDIKYKNCCLKFIQEGDELDWIRQLVDQSQYSVTVFSFILNYITVPLSPKLTNSFLQFFSTHVCWLFILTDWVVQSLCREIECALLLFVADNRLLKILLQMFRSDLIVCILPTIYGRALR